LDWKWLFIYPDQGVATVNELVAPVDVPINFKITSSSVMNSFFIPALAGQIYAMPGMETKLHAVINKAGVFNGFSANYSGAGFSGMHFKFHGVSQEDFNRWVTQAKASDGRLDRAVYTQLEKPSEKVPVRHFGNVDPELYGAILERCVAPGTTCMSEMMALANMCTTKSNADLLGETSSRPDSLPNTRPNLRPNLTPPSAPAASGTTDARPS
ncbi:MAG: COX aromatic rich motif-containing protein, partial [Gammaproteobacteria bacterium]|nr:COX aromatic rich motif-containing protein [Gammaproteobacteria bacterium]